MVQFGIEPGARATRPSDRKLNAQTLGSGAEFKVSSDFLFIVAEIAIAFAGFAGLVVAISARQGRSAERARLEFVLLRNVLMVGLLVVAFALFPSLLFEMGTEPAIAWRVSASVYFLVFGGFAVRNAPRHIAAQRAAHQRVPLNLWLTTTLTFALAIVSALCAVGIFPPNSFLVSLSGTLILGGASFVRVFMSVGRASLDA
jgi:hypothetical protein